MVKFNVEQRPDFVCGRPDSGRQVNESASVATDAPEIRLLLQVTAASQKFRPQFCIHVRPLVNFNNMLVLKAELRQSFSTCVCIFTVITLVGSNQRNYFENTKTAVNDR